MLQMMVKKALSPDTKTGRILLLDLPFKLFLIHLQIKDTLIETKYSWEGNICLFHLWKLPPGEKGECMGISKQRQLAFRGSIGVAWMWKCPWKGMEETAQPYPCVDVGNVSKHSQGTDQASQQTLPSGPNHCLGCSILALSGPNVFCYWAYSLTVNSHSKCLWIGQSGWRERGNQNGKTRNLQQPTLRNTKRFMTINWCVELPSEGDRRHQSTIFCARFNVIQDDTKQKKQKPKPLKGRSSFMPLDLDIHSKCYKRQGQDV